MDGAQTWAMIGVFTTVVLGGMTLMTTLLSRATSASIGGLRGEMNGRFDSVDVRLDGVDRRLDRMDQRLDRMDRRIDDLDRDVTMLIRRAWDDPPT